MERRTFLTSLGTGGAALLLAPSLPRTATASPPADEPWATVAAVQGHLLPDDGDGPGAAEVNATDFLRAEMARGQAERPYPGWLEEGLARLEALSRDGGGRPFRELSAGRREQALRRMEQDDIGARWLDEILSYTLEALLADPVYGGNPDGRGWDWLGHQPGYPRPPAERRYFRLG